MHEAQGRTGLVDLPLVQVVPGSRVAGRARTALCGNGDNLMVHAAVAHAEPGDVLVLTMPEPTPVALIGELLATQAIDQGVAAMLVDAAVRDVEELRELGLPSGRATSGRRATKEHVGELDTPVVVGGTRIAPETSSCSTPTAPSSSRPTGWTTSPARRASRARERASRTRYAAGERSYDVNDLRRLVEG